MTKTIRLYKGAAILSDKKDLEDKGITVEPNTEFVKEVKASDKNIKKYIKRREFPDIDRKPEK